MGGWAVCRVCRVHLIMPRACLAACLSCPVPREVPEYGWPRSVSQILLSSLADKACGWDKALPVITATIGPSALFVELKRREREKKKKKILFRRGRSSPSWLFNLRSPSLILSLILSLLIISHHLTHQHTPNLSTSTIFDHNGFL